MPITVSQSSTRAIGWRVMTSENSQAPAETQGGADLRQRAVEQLVETEHVDGEPAIAFAHPRRGAIEKDHERREQDLAALRLIEVLGDAVQHQRDDRKRDGEDDLLAHRQAAQADDEDGSTKHETAAKNAPVDRLRLGAVETDENGAGDGDRGDDEAEQEHGLVAEHLREPARKARDREHAGPQCEPAKHLDHAEVALDLEQRPRRAVGLRAIDDLGGHGIGDDVLEHDTDDDEELRSRHRARSGWRR